MLMTMYHNLLEVDVRRMSESLISDSYVENAHVLEYSPFKSRLLKILTSN